MGTVLRSRTTEPSPCFRRERSNSPSGLLSQLHLEMTTRLAGAWKEDLEAQHEML
jgi:hypothetical protein